MEGEETVMVALAVEGVIGDHPLIHPTIEETTGALIFLKVEMHAIIVVLAEVRVRHRTGVDAARATVEAPVHEDITGEEIHCGGMSLPLGGGVTPPPARPLNKSDAGVTIRKGRCPAEDLSMAKGWVIRTDWRTLLLLFILEGQY